MLNKKFDNIRHRKAEHSSKSKLSAEDVENEDEFEDSSKSSTKNGSNKPNADTLIAAGKDGNNVRQNKNKKHHKGKSDQSR